MISRRRLIQAAAGACGALLIPARVLAGPAEPSVSDIKRVKDLLDAAPTITDCRSTWPYMSWEYWNGTDWAPLAMKTERCGTRLVHTADLQDDMAPLEPGGFYAVRMGT